MNVGYSDILSTLGELREHTKDLPDDTPLLIETLDGSTDVRIYVYDTGTICFEPPYEED